MTGLKNQLTVALRKRVADVMEKLAGTLKPKFILSLGVQASEDNKLTGLRCINLLF